MDIVAPYNVKQEKAKFVIQDFDNPQEFSSRKLWYKLTQYS